MKKLKITLEKQITSLFLMDIVAKLKFIGITPSIETPSSIPIYSFLLYYKIIKNFIPDIEILSFKRYHPPHFKIRTNYGSQNQRKSFINDWKVNRIIDILNPFTWVIGLRLLLRKKPALIHFNLVSPLYFPLYFILLFPIRKLNKGKVKILASVHNILPHERTPLDWGLICGIIKMTDILIVHSQHHKKIMENIFPSKKILVIPLSKVFSEYERLFPYKKPVELDTIKINKEKAIAFFFGGFIRKYKGGDILLKALKIIDDMVSNGHNPKKTPYFIIAGQPIGKYGSNFEKEVRNLDKKLKHIKVIPIFRYLDDGELNWLISSSDWVVLPYINFNGQSAIGDLARKFNRKLITSNLEPFKELEPDIIINPSPEKLAQEILKLI